MTDDRGLAALALARTGMHVFPLREGTKLPRGKWKSMATDDPDLVAAMWERWPRDNIGIACGPSGLLILDVDVKGGKDGMTSLAHLELDIGDLPETRRARTASGGLHVYMRGSVGNSVERLGPGLDVRSVGGYVVAPGSEVDGGMWTWETEGDVADAPEALVGMCEAPRERDEDRGTPLVELDDPAAVERAGRYLEEDARPALEGEAGDERTLVTAMFVRDMGVSQHVALDLMLEHYNPRCVPPWEPDDMEKKVANAYSYSSERAGNRSPAADFGEPDAKAEGTAEEPDPSDFRYDEWIWAAGPLWFVRRRDGMRLGKQSFDSLFGHMTEGNKAKLSDEIFSSKTRMRKMAGLQFRPGADEFLGEKYNLWKDSGVRPIEGDASWLEEHVRWMCPGEREAELVLDYLAHLVQRRGEKMSFALLIHGLPGVGKSALGQLLQRMLGWTNVTRPNNEELHSNFSAWALATELVIIEELMAAGKMQMANKLKPLITEPSVRIEEKHRTPYTVENHMNFLMFTNWDNPIPIEKDDRRYLVVVSPVDPRPKAYYDALWPRILGEGASHALDWLMRRDLSGFAGKGIAPATEGKEAMRRAGMPEVESYLLERFEAEEPPFNMPLVSTHDMIECLPERLRRAPRLGNAVGGFLRHELRAQNLGQHRVNSGSTRRVLWAVRRKEMMTGLTAVERAKLYDEKRAEAA